MYINVAPQARNGVAEGQVFEGRGERHEVRVVVVEDDAPLLGLLRKRWRKVLEGGFRAGRIL